MKNSYINPNINFELEFTYYADDFPGCLFWDGLYYDNFDNQMIGDIIQAFYIKHIKHDNIGLIALNLNAIERSPLRKRVSNRIATIPVYDRINDKFFLLEAFAKTIEDNYKDMNIKTRIQAACFIEKYFANYEKTREFLHTSKLDFNEFEQTYSIVKKK